MKPKSIFWIACAAFIVLAVKFAVAGEQYLVMLVAACAIASAANALRPDANESANWTRLKKLFGIH